MSMDTYFCFCCLSTNDLMSLYSSNAHGNYASLLKDMFHIKVFQEYEDNIYICEQCAHRLRDMHTYKAHVIATLHILQVNGLIKINKTKDNSFIITKVSTDTLDKEIKYDKDSNITELDTKYYTEDIKYDPTKSEPNIIKTENNSDNIIEEIKTKDTTDVRIERDKHITVAKKGKRLRDVKHEPNYEVTNDFKCRLCAMVLPNINVYHSHMNEHYPNHVCEACGKGFLTEKRLKRHLPSHKKGLFKCQSCDAEFTNYNTLSSHRQRKHSATQVYKCPECSERFGTYTRRALHLAAAHAHPTGKHTCSVCKKQFLVAGNLSSHMRNKHLKVKRYFCQECEAGFFHKQELISHVAIHTGLNQYQCTICLKRYPRKKALRVHMRVHTNDKRFCCEVCGKKFIQKCTLMSHSKTHSSANGNGEDVKVESK